jgi:hypothetical protein
MWPIFIDDLLIKGPATQFLDKYGQDYVETVKYYMNKYFAFQSSSQHPHGFI